MEGWAHFPRPTHPRFNRSLIVSKYQSYVKVGIYGTLAKSVRHYPFKVVIAGSSPVRITKELWFLMFVLSLKSKHTHMEEWQRWKLRLTVNQVPQGYEGSNPSSSTNYTAYSNFIFHQENMEMKTHEQRLTYRCVAQR